MKIHKKYFICRVGGLFSALLFLAFSMSVEATAPRITPKMFGDERTSDIVAYQPAATGENSDSVLTSEIVTAAFSAAGKTPTIDVLPSKQLATYALLNNDAVAMIGNNKDLTEKDRHLHSLVTFYLRGDEAVVMIFNNKRGGDLRKAFVEGMQKIIKNGKYLEIFEKSRVNLPADYMSRLKRYNPSWK